MNELSKQIPYLYLKDLLEDYPPFPGILVMEKDDMPLSRVKLEALYEVSPPNTKQLISIMIAAYLLLKEVRSMPEIDSLVTSMHTPTMSVKNNPNCTCTCTCSKCTKSWYCEFCKKPFNSKDGRNKHRNRYCELNQNRKPKKIKTKRLQSMFQK